MKKFMIGLLVLLSTVGYTNESFNCTVKTYSDSYDPTIVFSEITVETSGALTLVGQLEGTGEYIHIGISDLGKLNNVENELKEQYGVHMVLSRLSHWDTYHKDNITYTTRSSFQKEQTAVMLGMRWPLNNDNDNDELRINVLCKKDLLK